LAILPGKRGSGERQLAIDGVAREPRLRRSIGRLRKFCASPWLCTARSAPPFRQGKARGRHYNLDAIISVGFRVNSNCRIALRAWANALIKDRLRHDPSRRTEESQRYLEGLKNVELLAHDTRTNVDARVRQPLLRDREPSRVDGNKRIGRAFPEERALVGLALPVAESSPSTRRSSWG
jgi:hypothetical protein